MTWLKDLATTNLRIVFTLGVFGGTAIKYWITDKSPTWEWLLFLATMSGADALTKVGIRATAKPEIIAAEADAAVRKIEATAAATPPLTPKEAAQAGALSQEGA